MLLTPAAGNHGDKMLTFQPEVGSTKVALNTVVYRGTRNGSNLNGRWEIPGNCDGVFRIQTGWQKWQGGFFQGGFYSMDLDNMYVGENGVRGGGSDSVGSFDINGWR